VYYNIFFWYFCSLRTNLLYFDYITYTIIFQYKNCLIYAWYSLKIFPLYSVFFIGNNSSYRAFTVLLAVWVLKCRALATRQRQKFVKGFWPAPFYAMQRRDYNCFMFFWFLLSANNYYRANEVCLGRKWAWLHVMLAEFFGVLRREKLGFKSFG